MTLGNMRELGMPLVLAQRAVRQARNADGRAAVTDAFRGLK
jgi:hypothetical protein